MHASLDMCMQTLLILNTLNNKGVQGTWCKRYIYHIYIRSYFLWLGGKGDCLSMAC